MFNIIDKRAIMHLNSIGRCIDIAKSLRLVIISLKFGDYHASVVESFSSWCHPQRTGLKLDIRSSLGWDEFQEWSEALGSNSEPDEASKRDEEMRSDGLHELN